MALRVVLSSSAIRDMAEIWHYVASHSEQNADRLIARFRREIDLLAVMPTAGHFRSEVPGDMRFLRVQSFSIAYWFDLHAVNVVRVIHGARDFTQIDFGRR